ncbi:hypothetical protein [Helicobacter kayseriensis]|uniref:hypothetical protein n=1 Tax=Helicobacter kayseriensis TaxID=2905877 RepID=UPI001E3CE567|nr:hypothetical protein [Helicobacter kayseriensis]MCE3046470.1 hypothetical protein [Helicobacter kayseriensis]MCE3048227.1 hypothetical protein [Helicobacter kayseriensis]
MTKASHLHILTLPNSYKLHGLRGYGADLHNHGKMGAKNMFWPLDIHPREFFANFHSNHEWLDLFCDDGFIDGRTYVSFSISGDTIRVYFDWIYPIILQNSDLKQAYEDMVIADQEYYKEILGVDEQTAHDFGRMRAEFRILDAVYGY